VQRKRADPNTLLSPPPPLHVSSRVSSLRMHMVWLASVAAPTCPGYAAEVEQERWPGGAAPVRWRLLLLLLSPITAVGARGSRGVAMVVVGEDVVEVGGQGQTFFATDTLRKRTGAQRQLRLPED